MDFYDSVTEENAKAWYDALPSHLKKPIDAALEQCTKADARERQKLDESMIELTSGKLGYELPEFVVVNRTPEGNMPDEIERFDRRLVWCRQYNELLFTNHIVREAPRIQKERKMLAQALGLKQGGNGLPNQAEGLDDTQAATIRWLQTSGETPLEYLTSVYRNDDSEVRTSDKIAAARALLDYVHRKVPAQIEVKGPSTEDVAEHAAIARDIGDQLAKYAAITKKLDK